MRRAQLCSASQLHCSLIGAPRMRLHLIGGKFVSPPRALKPTLQILVGRRQCASSCFHIPWSTKERLRAAESFPFDWTLSNAQLTSPAEAGEDNKDKKRRRKNTEKNIEKKLGTTLKTSPREFKRIEQRWCQPDWKSWDYRCA